MRDMSNIAKINHLVTVIDERTTEAEQGFARHIKDYDMNLQKCMEWGDTLFKHAAYQHIWSGLAERLMDLLNKRGQENPDAPNFDITGPELIAIIRDENKFLKALPRSTSPSHNIAEATLLQAVLDVTTDGWELLSLMHKAQRLDPEYQAWCEEQVKQAQADKAALKLQQEVLEQVKQDARRTAKRAIKRGETPSESDLLVGWPTQDEVDKVRNDKLRDHLNSPVIRGRRAALNQ